MKKIPPLEGSKSNESIAVISLEVKENFQVDFAEGCLEKYGKDFVYSVILNMANIITSYRAVSMVVQAFRNQVEGEKDGDG